MNPLWSSANHFLSIPTKNQYSSTDSSREMWKIRSLFTLWEVSNSVYFCFLALLLWELELFVDLQTCSLVSYLQIGFFYPTSPYSVWEKTNKIPSFSTFWPSWLRLCTNDIHSLPLLLLAAIPHLNLAPFGAPFAPQTPVLRFFRWKVYRKFVFLSIVPIVQIHQLFVDSKAAYVSVIGRKLTKLTLSDVRLQVRIESNLSEP